VQDDKEPVISNQQETGGAKQDVKEGDSKEQPLQNRVSAHPPKTFFQLIESQVLFSWQHPCIFADFFIYVFMHDSKNPPCLIGLN
jgi:hypothetical protein